MRDFREGEEKDNVETMTVLEGKEESLRVP